MIPIALSSWSLHTLFLNSDPHGLRANTFPRLAKESLGIGRIEFYEGDYAPNLLDPGFDDLQHANTVTQQCRQYGMKVVCLAAINNLTHHESEARASDRARILRLARHCEVLGCPIIRINTGRLRLDSARASRFRDEILRLSDALADRPVRLAIENHPHILDSDEGIDLLAGLIRGIERPNVGSCPDVGAMGTGMWERGLSQLAPMALHVHLKPFVRDAEFAPRGLSETPLAEYACKVREILAANDYQGAVSYEALPTPIMTANPIQSCREALEILAKVFSNPLGPATPAGLPQPSATKRTLNRDPELVPSTGILQMLADGCEQRLEAQTRIHDFGSKQVVLSRSSAHRPESSGPGNPPSGHFCTIASQDSHVAGLCRAFHDEKLALIRDGQQDRPRICICPMGLMILAVPVFDDANVFGAISSGPWIEEGTEGMVIDSIMKHASLAQKEDLESASLLIRPFSPQELLETQGVLVSLAKDLAGLYHEHQRTRRYLSEGSSLIKWMHDRSRAADSMDPDRFIEDTLGEAFSRFEQLAGYGQVALYRRRTTPDGASELSRVMFPHGRGGLPSSIPLTPTGGPPFAVLEQFLRTKTLQSCLAGERGPEDLLVVFSYPAKQPPAGDLRSLFQQFATETYYIISNLRNLREANQRREEMIIFVNQFKHRISSTLQGILDNTGLIRKSFQGIRALHPKEIEALVLELDGYSTEASDILDLFTWSVRLGGQGSLRPQLSFEMVDLAEIISESVRKLKRSAARRQISMKKAELKAPVYIFGDPNALAEIFDNLIENAIKFANDGSYVEVKAIDSAAAKVPVWSLDVPGRRFAVCNQGLGLAPDELEEVFKPMKQGRARSPSRVIPGTGLGLAVCRQIVSEHGGRIWITSKPAPKAASPDDLRDCLVVVYLDLPNKPPPLPAVPAGGS